MVDTMREVSKSSEDDLGPKFDDPSSVMSGVVDEGGVSHIPERKVRFGDQFSHRTRKEEKRPVSTFRMIRPALLVPFPKFDIVLQALLKDRLPEQLFVKRISWGDVL